MGDSDIEWTDKTWNPVRGCTIVSAGCKNCYAMKFAHRFSAEGKPYAGLTQLSKNGPVWKGAARFVPEMLRAPLGWSKPARVFVNSMSDLFHDDVTDDQIAEVFGVMAVCGADDTTNTSGQPATFGTTWNDKLKRWNDDAKGPHTFQVLTKRPQRMHRLLTSSRFRELVAGAAYRHAHNQRDAGYLSDCISARNQSFAPGLAGRSWPLSNVWLGVSCEDQKSADERVGLLMQTPAAVHFISAEPLLGPIDFDLKGFGYESGGDQGWIETKRPDWVIVGGESGPGARPCDVEWIRSIVKQCREAEVSCFVKQLGALPQDSAHCDVLCNGKRHYTRAAGDSSLAEAESTPGYSVVGHRLTLGDRKGGDMAEWPEDLRVRQFPEVSPCTG